MPSNYKFRNEVCIFNTLFECLKSHNFFIVWQIGFNILNASYLTYVQKPTYRKSIS